MTSYKVVGLVLISALSLSLGRAFLAKRVD